VIDREGENLDAGTETNSNLDHQLYYHFLGTDQSEDILCWENPDNPQYTLGASVTEDGKVTNISFCEDTQGAISLGVYYSAMNLSSLQHMECITLFLFLTLLSPTSFVDFSANF